MFASTYNSLCYFRIPITWGNYKPLTSCLQPLSLGQILFSASLSSTRQHCDMIQTSHQRARTVPAYKSHSHLPFSSNTDPWEPEFIRPPWIRRFGIVAPQMVITCLRKVNFSQSVSDNPSFLSGIASMGQANYDNLRTHSLLISLFRFVLWQN